LCLSIIRRRRDPRRIGSFHPVHWPCPPRQKKKEKRKKLQRAHISYNFEHKHHHIIIDPSLPTPHHCQPASKPSREPHGGIQTPVVEIARIVSAVPAAALSSRVDEVYAAVLVEAIAAGCCVGWDSRLLRAVMVACIRRRRGRVVCSVGSWHRCWSRWRCGKRKRK